MVDPVWIALIADNFLLISIIVAQYLIYKRVQVSHVSEKRVEHFIEAYKNNTIVHHSLSQIELGKNQKENVDRIQEIVEKHPYNFSLYFQYKWSQLKDEVTEILPEKGIKVLYENLAYTEKMYYKKYQVEVLRFKKEEFKEFANAFKGTFDGDGM